MFSDTYKFNPRIEPDSSDWIYKFPKQAKYFGASSPLPRWRLQMYFSGDVQELEARALTCLHAHFCDWKGMSVFLKRVERNTLVEDRAFEYLQNLHRSCQNKR